MDTWFMCNKLSLNINKTNIIFHSTKETSNENSRLFINGQVIERVKSTKFLGIEIDLFNLSISKDTLINY